MIGRKRKTKLPPKQLDVINQWCYNARRLGYTKKDIRKRIKSYPRNIRKRILQTFKDLEYVEKTNKWLNEMKKQRIEKSIFPEENIENIFRMGSKFYLKTGNLDRTFELMDKRIERIEHE